MHILTKLFWTVLTYLQAYWVQITELFGGFFLLVVALGYLWYRVKRNINKKLTQPFRDAMERKNIKVIDGRPQ